METDKKHIKKSLQAVYTGIASVFILLSGIVLSSIFAGLSAISPEFSEKISQIQAAEEETTLPVVAANIEEDPFSPEKTSLPADSSKESAYIRYGHELIIRTSDLIGPNSDKPFAGNNLNCQNCHLNAGTKKFSVPFVGVSAKFPQYSSREDSEGNISDRVNGCMERSMNGKKLPENSKEMRAMEAYMKWLSRDIKIGQSIEFQSFKSIEIPDRSVDLVNGKTLYEQKCASCHQTDGSGQLKNTEKGYIYPPLWGRDSYNTGAGMHRVLTAAQFIKSNMPLGATYDRPLLSDEEAFDIAGYINNMARPNKKNTEKDFPDLKEKPASTPYPPYADNFSQQQHKFGPFPEIINFYKQKYNILKIK